MSRGIWCSEKYELYILLSFIFRPTLYTTVQDLANLTIGQRASRYSSEIDLACATSYFWFSTGFGAIPEALMRSTCTKARHAANSVLSTGLDTVENPQLRQLIQDVQREVLRDAYLSRNSSFTNVNESTSSLSSSQHDIFSYARSLGEEYCSLIPVRRKMLGVKSSSSFLGIQSQSQSQSQSLLQSQSQSQTPSLTPAIVLTPDVFAQPLADQNSLDSSTSMPSTPSTPSTPSLSRAFLTNTVSLPPQPSLVPLTSRDKLRLYVFDIFLPYVIHKASLMRVVDLSSPPPLPSILAQSPWAGLRNLALENSDVEIAMEDLNAVEKQRRMRLRHQLQMQRRVSQMAAVEVGVGEEDDARGEENQVEDDKNTPVTLSTLSTLSPSEFDSGTPPELEDSELTLPTPPHRSFGSRV